MKTPTPFGIAVAAIILTPAASAQTRVMQPHPQTISAFECLVDHLKSGCGENFVGNARPVATFWLWWTPDKDARLGPLLSANYAGTESVNGYITKFVNGETADVYGANFKHQNMTFYIVPPGPDGKVHHIYVRNGSPDDEDKFMNSCNGQPAPSSFLCADALGGRL